MDCDYCSTSINITEIGLCMIYSDSIEGTTTLLSDSPGGVSAMTDIRSVSQTEPFG